jgi:TatD DNase family protein
MLIDTHTHVQVGEFSRDRDQVILAAFAAMIDRLIVPGVDVETSRDAIALAATYPGQIFAAVGTHPHEADLLTDLTLSTERELATACLDYSRNLSPPESQRQALIKQLALARELGLPVVLHNRESHKDMIAHLREYGQNVTGVFHCFVGDRDMARDALDLGFYLSFAGPVTYPANAILAQVAAWAPADRILVETDSPYLAPVPVRGKRNEPRHVRLIAEHIAGLRGITLEEMAAITTANAERVFGLPGRHVEKE